jgi:hypothetical protein
MRDSTSKNGDETEDKRFLFVYSSKNGKEVAEKPRDIMLYLSIADINSMFILKKLIADNAVHTEMQSLAYILMSENMFKSSSYLLTHHCQCNCTPISAWPTINEPSRRRS